MIEKKNYIKVTPKGETRSVVVLAALAAFYKKHGATIEDPTEEEIIKAFPELAKSVKTEQGTDLTNLILDSKKLIELKDAEIEGFKKELAEANKEIETLNGDVKFLNGSIEKLNANLESAATTIGNQKAEIEKLTAKK